MRGMSRATAFALTAAVVHLVLAWMMRTPGLGWGEDDSAFLLLSQDLQSFHYRETQDILAPVHARFPPVFPAMLAVVGGIFGNRLDVLFAFVGLCSAASVLLLFDATRRAIGEEIAVLVTALYAINPSALADAGSMMSESPFKLFLYLALWGAVRDSEGTRFAVVAGAATILGALTRTAGVVFIPALGFYWFVKRRYTWVVGLAIASIPVVAWLGFAFNAPDAHDRRLYVADLKSGEESFGDALAQRFGRLIPRLWLYLTNYIPWTVAVPTVGGTPLDNVVWVVSFGVFGIAGILTLLRQWESAALFLAAYGVLLAVWRYSFDRLVRPIVPLLFLILLAGASTLIGKYRPRQRRWVVWGAAALLGLGAVRLGAPEFSKRLACDRASPAESPECWPRAERELLTLAHWVRDSTPPEALLFVSKERAFYVHSGRKSINQDRGLREDSTTIGSYLRSRGVDYTAVTPVGVYSRRHRVLLRGACRDFELVKVFSRQTLLLRVLPEPAPGDDTPACEAIRDFNQSDNPTP